MTVTASPADGTRTSFAGGSALRATCDGCGQPIHRVAVTGRQRSMPSGRMRTVVIRWVDVAWRHDHGGAVECGGAGEAA